jgi:hypothetical protein
MLPSSTTFSKTETAAQDSNDDDEHFHNRNDLDDDDTKSRTRSASPPQSHEDNEEDNDDDDDDWNLQVVIQDATIANQNDNPNNHANTNSVTVREDCIQECWQHTLRMHNDMDARRSFWDENNPSSDVVVTACSNPRDTGVDDAIQKVTEGNTGATTTTTTTSQNTTSQSLVQWTPSSLHLPAWAILPFVKKVASQNTQPKG